MEGKIKYGMFELSIGSLRPIGSLQYELVGLLEKKDDEGKTVIQSDVAEVNDFLQELDYFQKVLKDYDYLLCSFDSTTWSYQVSLLERRDKKITSGLFDGFDMITSVHDVNMKCAFAKMEKSLKVLFTAREVGCLQVDVLEKVRDGYLLEVDFDDEKVCGKLVKRQEDTFSDILYVDHTCLDFLEELPIDREALPLEYGIDVWYDEEVGLYQSSLSFKVKKHPNRYSYEQVYGGSDTDFISSLLTLSDKVNPKEKEKMYGKK